MNRRELMQALLGAMGAMGVVGWRPLSGSRSVRSSRHAGSVDARQLEPFTIDYSPPDLEDLRRRLEAVRWPEMPFDTGWAAGTNDAVLRELVEYWRSEYDWFEVQAALNELTHLRGPIEGENLHCVLYAGSEPSPFPLLLLHGWPATFHEFSKGAPLLAAGVQGGRPFDLVVPSLPGYGFSDAPREPGMSPARIAQRLHALMGELGHERYGVQGGDWGAIIGSEMARRYPDAIVGLHINMVASFAGPPAGTTPSAEEEAYRAQLAVFQRDETGYQSIQGTRPQTLAYAQHDSPVGWLAWILEKYWAWSDHGDDIWDTFDRDDILTTAMLYWLPGRILSAARLYYENSNPNAPRSVGGRVEVPTGYARFPAEIYNPPREVVERSYNLVHYSEPAVGGHFAALEQPGTWANDVGRFFGGLV